MGTMPGMSTDATHPTGPELLLVITTVASRDEARRLARALVQRRLVACAQISEIESLYEWQGAVAQEPEWRLLLKTEASRYPALEAAIRELHSYDLPAIVAVPVSATLPAFADWVAQSVAQAVKGR